MQCCGRHAHQCCLATHTALNIWQQPAHIWHLMWSCSTSRVGTCLCHVSGTLHLLLDCPAWTVNEWCTPWCYRQGRGSRSSLLGHASRCGPHRVGAAAAGRLHRAASTRTGPCPPLAAAGQLLQQRPAPLSPHLRTERKDGHTNCKGTSKRAKVWAMLE